MIDIVIIRNTETGISHKIVRIQDLASAEKEAKFMTRYHGEKYEAIVKNVSAHLYPHLCEKGV